MCFVWEGLNLLLVLGFYCWIFFCEKNLKSSMFCLGGAKCFVSFRIFLLDIFVFIHIHAGFAIFWTFKDLKKY